ncbi:hypothetical protein KW790_01050 [Candidatus Parcubacteria bacterium]|nr:hypothetical protein [Candidatus Parcubacteria bacterium]
MRVVEVVPFARGITRDKLSYFTKEDLPLGTLVRIPIRKSSYLGLIIGSREVEEAKLELRSADFTLRKLEEIERVGSVPESLVKASLRTGVYFAATTGSVLGAILPKIFLDIPSLMGEGPEIQKVGKKEALLIQLPTNERMQEYNSIVRSSFARKESVLLIVPTREDALRLEFLLSKGIEKFTFTLSGKSVNIQKEILAKARDEKHPILFITTPGFLSFTRRDLCTIIIERENSRSYKTLKRPYLNYKIFIQYLAEETGATLILGDTVLSLESLKKAKEDVYSEYTPLSWNVKSNSQIRVMNMRESRTERESPRDFEIFSKKATNLISKALEEKKKIFLFGARKGLAHTTVCGHCGALLLCKNCGAPVVLHKLKDSKEPTQDRIYICHHCGARRDALTTCDKCGSWKLIPLGIGTDRIIEELKLQFPKAPIFILDKEHTPTGAKASKVAKEFASTRGGILVGTELALLYLEKVPYSIVVSLDSLFSIPDFTINERIFYLLTHLKEVTEVDMLIQTRNRGEVILDYATEGTILEFYRFEMKEREELYYPPLSLFIKVSIEDERSSLKTHASLLENLFRPWNPEFIEERGLGSHRSILSMIMRVGRSNWPVKELSEKLLLLPPSFSIKVDPESIL